MPEEADNRKTKLIKAGIELITGGDGAAFLYSGLTAEVVAKKAGYAGHQSFNQEYPGAAGGKAKYLEDLLPALISGSTRSAAHLDSTVKETLTLSKGEPIQVVRQLAAENFKLGRDDPAMLQRLAAFVLARNNPHVVEALRNDYDRITQYGVSAYTAIFAKWGVAIRAPFTPMLLAIVLTALGEGLALRARIEPDRVPDSLLGHVVVALLVAIVDVEQRGKHLDDVAMPISEAVRLTYNVEVNGALPDNPRRAVIDAARYEFGQHGYFTTSLSDISTRSQVPLHALRQLFPSKDAILADALSSDVDELARSIAADKAMGIDELSMIERHIGRLATVLLANIEFKEALIATVHERQENSGDLGATIAAIDLPGLIAPTIEAGQRRNTIYHSDDAYEMASILTNTLMLRCFNGGTQRSASATAEAVSGTLLHGMCTRR